LRHFGNLKPIQDLRVRQLRGRKSHNESIRNDSGVAALPWSSIRTDNDITVNNNNTADDDVAGSNLDDHTQHYHDAGNQS